MNSPTKIFYTKIHSIGIFFLSFPIVFLLNSCLFSNCNEVQLSKDDKTWIQCYGNVDTILFTSNYSNVDTFVLEEKYDAYTTCSKFELGPDVYNYIGIDYSKLSNSKKSSQHIYIGIDKDFSHGEGRECIKSFQIYDLNASFDSLNKRNLNIKWVEFPRLSKNKIKSMNFEVGDEFSGTSEDIKSFVWSKKYGLLRYELKTGEIFSLTSLN